MLVKNYYYKNEFIHTRVRNHENKIHAQLNPLTMNRAGKVSGHPWSTLKRWMRKKVKDTIKETIDTNWIQPEAPTIV